MSEPGPNPKHPVAMVRSKNGETFKIGAATARVMEDGSNTDNRLSALELTVPPHTSGPPPHYHMMHDETFLITQGKIRFTLPALPSSEPGVEAKIIDAEAGDYAVVPIEAPHTFSNPFDEEAKFFNTFSPAFYIDYFRLLAKNASEGKTSKEDGIMAMGRYATLPAGAPRSAGGDTVTPVEK